MDYKKRIVIVSEAYPPDYSGAGISAQFLAKDLQKERMLYKIVTRTKDKIADTANPSYIDETFFYRIVYFNKQIIRNANNTILKFILVLLDFPLVFFKTTLFFLNHKKETDIFLFISTKWISLVLSFWCVIFRKKYIIETTLIGNDDPIVSPHKKYKWIKRIIKNFQFKNSTAVTNVSKLLYGQCIKFGLSPKKVYTIPCSVNINRFCPQNDTTRQRLKLKLIKTDQPYPILLFVGVLIKRKGIDIVYNTFKSLMGDYPNALLVFAGPKGAHGQQELLREIEQDIIKENIEDQVLFTGSVSNIEDYFNIADIFFFPTREEGFGKVFTEAMACGLPVVAKEIEGITDYIFKNGVDGVIVKGEEPEDYLKAIKSLLDDNSFREKIISNAMSSVKKDFSEEAVLIKYHSLFNKVLERN